MASYSNVCWQRSLYAIWPNLPVKAGPRSCWLELSAAYFGLISRDAECTTRLSNLFSCLTVFLVKTLEIKSAFLLLQHNFCLLHPALPLLASVWNLFCFFYNSFQAAENINKMNPRPILTSPHSPYFIHVLQNTSHQQELRKEQTMIAKQMPSCLKK